MELYYKNVIIGGGPAGMAAAIMMQRRGMEVCVIDKAVFPRKKICAGLVTYKTYKLINLIFNGKVAEDMFCDSSDTIRLYRKKNLLVKASLGNEVRFVKRYDFDKTLVEEYESLYGLLMEGQRNISVDHNKNRIILSNGDNLYYEYLIYADGALSMSRRYTGIDKRKLGFGIEVNVSAECFDTDSIDVFFDYLSSGYAWAFPHGDSVCIGLCSPYDEKNDYKGALESVLMDMNIETDKLKYTAAFLPYGYAADQKKLPDNVMLIGDAAGFTDPVSGEGLYMALKSGILAANSLLSSAPKKKYMESTQIIRNIVKDGKNVQRMLDSGPASGYFYKKVRNNDRLVSFYFDNIVGEYRYDYGNLRSLFSDYKKLYR